MKIAALGLALVVIWSPAHAQSLFILDGERAVEGAVGWSVGPVSHGVETHAAFSWNGRWDIGFGFNRYVADLGGNQDSIVRQQMPFARLLLVKEDEDGIPVSLAAQGSFARDDYDAGDDPWYAQAGPQLFKKLTLTRRVVVYPFVGFALTAESSVLGAFAGRPSWSLSRQFGALATFAVGADGFLRLSVEEQSFRRETFRGARAGYVRRF